MKQRSLHAVLLLAVLVLLWGCGKAEENGEEAAAGASSAPEKTAADQETQEAVEKANGTKAPIGEREITDMAGRKVVVPKPGEIEKVFPTDPTAGIFLYTLVPDRLLGWNYELNDTEKSIILEKYQDLPNFGMGDAVNYEAVIAAGPDLALVVGALNDKTSDQADKLTESLGIPAVVVSSSLEDAPGAYRFMGELFGVQEDAEALSVYAERTFEDIAAMDVPEDEKVRMYYGNGEDAMETAPAGSGHAQIIDMTGAVNVADLELGDGSRVQISLEQLLSWDPDVIVVNGEPKANVSGRQTAEKILKDPDFASLKAVQNGQVYGTPNAPFSWVDRPPGPNRLIGIRWLSGLIYPDALAFDVDEEVREFFRLFYHVELTGEQLASLYDGTIGQEN